MRSGSSWFYNIVPILVALSLSFFLWLIISGQDKSTMEISVPLEYSLTTPGLIIEDNLPSQITITLQANPAQRNLLENRKIIMPLSLAEVKAGPNTVFIDIDDLNLPRGVTALDVEPRSIFFEAKEALEKIVPVKIEFVGKLNKHLVMASPHTKPEKVTVYGSSDRLKNLKMVSTDPITLNDLTQSRTFTSKVFAADEQIKIEPAEVQVVLEVAEKPQVHTLSNVPINLKFLQGEEDRWKITMSPAQVKVMLSWPQAIKYTPKIEDLVVEMLVDDSHLAAGRKNSLPIIVSSKVEDVKIVAIEPTHATIECRPR